MKKRAPNIIAKEAIAMIIPSDSVKSSLGRGVATVSIMPRSFGKGGIAPPAWLRAGELFHLVNPVAAKPLLHLWVRELVRPADHGRNRIIVVVEGRRRCMRPFERGHLPWVLHCLLSKKDAPEEVHDKDRLKRDQRERS